MALVNKRDRQGQGDSSNQSNNIRTTTEIMYQSPLTNGEEFSLNIQLTALKSDDIHTKRQGRKKQARWNWTTNIFYCQINTTLLRIQIGFLSGADMHHHREL